MARWPHPRTAIHVRVPVGSGMREPQGGGPPEVEPAPQTAAHADVAGLRRPRLLLGRVVEALTVAGEGPRRSAICLIERPSNSR
jgi:hypothetical protein